MAESHVVSGLVAKRSEMAGLIQHYQAEIRRVESDLGHLDATIKLFAPEIDLRTLRAKEHRARSSYFKPGECQRMVLDIFREAAAPVSSRQISEELLARKGLDATTALIEQTQKGVLAIIKRLEAAETILPAGKDGSGRTWQLV